MTKQNEPYDHVEILVVDDEEDIVELISYNLEKEGFTVRKAYNGEDALKSVRESRPKLIILDLMLPGIQGLEVSRTIRNSADLADIPIVMLTAKGEEIDKIIGLEMGADDYITKPFSIRELIARVRAVLRRSETIHRAEDSDVFTCRNLKIDYTSYTVSIKGEAVDISPTEYRLLKFLSQHPGRVYTRDQLLDRVWGDEAFVEPRTVDVHIRRLRTHIEEDLSQPYFIQTVRGVGYKFADCD